jgi:mRNA-degrading endonuclease toxin of MazEF toxin-antitoxin module
VAKPGRIVLVQVPDPQGRNVKSRPVVIVRVDDDQIVGVAISGQTEKDAKFRVLLPWQAQGNVVTKLKKKCAALCDWIVTFEESAIEEYKGVVPTDTFREILEKTNLD